MIILPVVTREMSVLSRRRGTYMARMLTAALAMFVIGWLFLVAVAGLTFAQIGQSIFIGVASLAFLYALLVGIHATSDAISEEKREGTLGLLFLTDLKSYDITLGKLAATSLNAFYSLLGLIPMLALAVLLGGVTLHDVGRVALVLANTMFLSLSLGMLVSALSVNERRAIFAAFILLALLTLAPPLGALVWTGFQSLPAPVMAISPLYPFLCAVDPNSSMPGLHAKLFYPALAFQHLLGWIFLFRATRLLPTFVLGVPRKWRDRLAARINEYVYGSLEERREHRRRLLDRNAFLWLAGRERVKPLWAWIMIAIFLVLYLWVALGFGGLLFDLHTSATLLFLSHLVIKLWVASEVSSRLIQDRRSGALELLLTSPLSVREIAAGQHLALRRLFGGPLVVLVLTELLLLFLAMKFMTRTPPPDRVLTYLAAISTLLLDLWTLKWLALWLSLFGKSMERVLVATAARVLVLPWLLFLGLGAWISATLVTYGRRPDYRELLLVWWAFGIGFSVWFGIFARRHFLRQCREAAADQHETPAALARAVFRRKPATRARRLIPAFAQRRPVLAAFVLLMALGLGVLGARRVYWSTQLAAEVEVIRSRDEPAKLLEIPMVYPSLPKSADAFAALAEAGMVNRPPPRGTTVNWNLFETPGTNHLRALDATDREMFNAILKNNAAQFKAFQSILHFTNAYADPLMDYQNVHRIDLHGYADLVAVELKLAAEARDAVRVRNALRLAVHYAKLLRLQPVWQPQFVAGKVLTRLAVASEEIYFRKLLSEADLSVIQNLVREIDSPDVLRRQLIIARAFALDPPPRFQTFLPGRNRFAGPGRAFAEALGMRQKEMVGVLRRFDDAIALTSRTPIDRFLWTTNLTPFTDFNAPPGPSLAQLHDAQIQDIIVRDTRALAQIRLLEAAFALERHFQKHGSHPPTLDALVPEFLTAPPVDPFSGEILKWRHSSDGPMLWSIGPNGQDDGGAAGYQGSGDFTFHFWQPAPP